MAYLLSSERPAAAAMPSRALERIVVRPMSALATWVFTVRAKTARRDAIAQLRNLDAARLRDLGLEPMDIEIAARATTLSVGQVLHAARARNTGL